MLRDPELEADPRTIASVVAAFDPALRRAIEDAAEDAFRRGVAEGRAAGLRQGREDLERLGAAVRASLNEAVEAVRDARISQAQQTVALATAMAAHVLDREPGDEARALLQRVEAWLAEIDDRPVQLAVSTEEAGIVAAALEGYLDVTVTAESSLRPGEARLVGRWASAELTRAARWEEIREALDGV